MRRTKLNGVFMFEFIFILIVSFSLLLYWAFNSDFRFKRMTKEEQLEHRLMSNVYYKEK